MSPSKNLKGLVFACTYLLLSFIILLLSMNIINNNDKIYAINTRGVISYKEILSEQGKMNYSNCLECYNEYENEFEVNFENIKDFDEEWKRLNRFVTYDNPIHSIRKANLSENQIKLIKDDQSSYIKILNEESYNYEEVYKATISKLNFLNEEFSEKYITDREYIENVFNYLLKETEYDYTYTKNNIYEAAVNSNSDCLGLSSALKYLLDKRMIPNFIAEGYINDQFHCWNEVYLEDKWYLLDLTSNDNNLKTLSEYNDVYKISEITEELVEYYDLTL